MALLRLFLLMIFLYCISCRSNNSEDFEKVLMVDINDLELLNNIRNYVAEYEIDPKAKIITVTIFTIGDREIIYISHANQLLYSVTGYPTYLSSIDGQLIFIYSNIDRYVKRDVSESINKYLDEFNISLTEYEPDSFVPSYHPQMWKLTKCSTDTFFVEKRGGGALWQDYAPCGYQIDLDDLKLDTMNFKPINIDSLIRANLNLYKPTIQHSH
jgi:hypothetical protein